MSLTSPISSDPLQVSPDTLVLTSRPIRTDRGLPPSRFSDGAWNLHPALEDIHQAQHNIRWDRFPAPFVNAAKHHVFALINVVDDPPRLPFARSIVPAVKTIWSDLPFLRHFLRWLVDRRRSNLAEVTHEDLQHYLLAVQDLEMQSPAWKRRALVAVQRLQLYRDYLPQIHRLPAGRLWSGATAAELAQDPGPTHGQNRTPRIHPDVMEPLLSAALISMNVIASDLLPTLKHLLAMRIIGHSVEPPARQATAREVAPYQGSAEQLDAFLPALASAGLPLPTVMTERGQQIDVVGLSVAGRIGQNNLRLSTVRDQVLSQRLPPINDHLRATRFSAHNGHRWRTEPIDAAELREILRHLVAAAFLVICYLSGVRTGEALNLRRGCVTYDPTLQLHLMSGLQMKAGDVGRVRSAASLPWVVIDEVRQAVEFLEAVTVGDILFPAGKVFLAQWMNPTSARTRTSGRINADLNTFITWFNTHVAPRIQHPTIPADEHGPITAPRLRRTLAWHIVRRPGGLVAGATQYGHVRTQITQGYSGRADAGFRTELAFETLLARVDSLHADAQRLKAGETVSGPASALYTERVIRAGEFAGHAITSRGQERQMLANPALNVHHGDLVTCVFKPETALCVSSAQTTPNLSRCQLACSNVAITDRDAATVSAEMDSLGRTLALVTLPDPLRQRLTSRREALSIHFDSHAGARSAT